MCITYKIIYVFRFHFSLFTFDQKTVVIFSNTKQKKQKLGEKAEFGRNGKKRKLSELYLERGLCMSLAVRISSQ